MTELALQISNRLQEEGVPQELAREVAQLFDDKKLTFYTAAGKAISGLKGFYAQCWDPKGDEKPV